MKRVIIIFVIMILGLYLFGQNTIDNILTEVEKNNSTLLAIRKNIAADKIGNKTGLLPKNPEAEFNYLWGNPTTVGNRTDFNIKQSFDFPSVYSYKSQISNLKNGQADLDYQKQRGEIFSQTRLVCTELTFQNALKVELNKRLTNATQIANACKSKFIIGETGILEYNKAQINLLNITKEAENNEIERNVLLAELAMLNGGTVINFNDSFFVQPNISPDFEVWYAQVEQENPVLQWIKQEIEVSELQKQLSSALNLPKFNAGYMSEKVEGQQFKGISVGVSIPLWENRNTVKYAKAQTIALQSFEIDAKLQYFNSMKLLHTKVKALLSNVADYHSNLAKFNNNSLLEKAFNNGEISLAEYIYEFTLYYESINKLLEMEMNLNLAIIELIRYQK